MGPKRKRAVNKGRPRGKRDAKVVTQAECPQPERGSSPSASGQTSASNGDVLASPTLKPIFPVTKCLKPILRAARRLSQNALRRASVGRPSGENGDNTDREKNKLDSVMVERPPRQSTAVKKKIRFRDSEITVYEISPLPDKLPGIVRMPSPPRHAKKKSGKKEMANITSRRKPEPKPAKLSTLTQDFSEFDLGPVPYTEEPQEDNDDVTAPLPVRCTPITDDMVQMWRHLQLAKNDENENNLPPQRPLPNDDLMVVDDIPSAGAQSAPRHRRRSFLDAERKLKELAVVKTRVVGMAPVRQRRYSVSSRQIPENSLINPNMVSRAKPPLRAGGPVEIDDDNLGHVWEKLKENTELHYAADFLGMKIFSSYRKKTLEAENSGGNVTPWTQIYRPQSSEEFIGNRSTVDSLLSWLAKWKNHLQRQNETLEATEHATKRSSKTVTYDRGKNADKERKDGPLANWAFIRGPTGIGKTCLVYALAEELGFEVIELNCSSLRNQQTLSSLEGATQAQGKNLNNVAPATRSQRATKNAAVPKKRTGKKIPSPPPPKASAEVEVTELDDKVKMSIILLDDVDVVFESDERFWQGVQDISGVARVPILLTCKDLDISCYPISALNVEYFHLYPIQDADTPAQYFRLLLLSRRISLENELDFVQFCRGFNGDLRACLVGLEFWLGNRSSTHVKTTRMKNRRRAKTPLQQAIEPPKERVDEFDLLNYDLRCLRDQFDKTRTVKWPCKLLDGLKDETPGNSQIPSQEQLPNRAQEKFISTFKDTINESTPFSGEPFDGENVQQISDYRRMTQNSGPGSSLTTFHRNEFVLDYLPTLRSIAASDRVMTSTGRGNRKRQHYLQKVGLDDKSGSLRAMLMKGSF